jgi:hypothetical protein
LNALAGTADQGFGFSKAIPSSLPRQDDDTIIHSSNPSRLLPPRSALQSASLHPCAHDEIGCGQLALDAPVADRASAACPSAYIGLPSDARICCASWGLSEQVLTSLPPLGGLALTMPSHSSFQGARSACAESGRPRPGCARARGGGLQLEGLSLTRLWDLERSCVRGHR